MTASARTSSPDLPREPIGRTLGRFVLHERLPSSGRAMIFRAEQPNLERPAIVKILDPRTRPSRDAVARFLREARLASMLDHPYAAHVYDAGAEPDGLLWIAMELVRGTPLDALIRSQGRTSVERCVPFLERLCQVVQTAHDQGLVHRDIKPANVMVVARAGSLLPKLLDLGVAKLAGELDHGELLGSPAYMAPEQWLDGDRSDVRSDLYQLGVLSWQMLAGRLPFEHPTLPALANAHATSPVPPLPAPVPEALDAVFARALAKRPADRFDSALAFAAALRSAAGTRVRSTLPQLDETLRDALIRTAPQPIADAIVALEAARDPAAAWRAIGDVVTIAIRWLGVLALCGRARIGDVRGGALPLLERLRGDRLGDAEWIALARELCRPFADKRDVFAIPELVALFASESGEARDPFARTSAACASVDGERIGDALHELAVALRAIAFVRDYRLAVAVARGFELWTGAAHAPRIQVPAGGAALAEGTVVLLSADGAPVLELSPLVQIAPPSPGAARELFLLDGGGRRGARLVAHPSPFERQDDRPWTWLAERGLLADTRRATTSDDELRAPWRGLATLSADDAALFVGREREVEAVVNRLHAQPLLAVVGPSGVGKSSFVHAGIVPALAPQWSAISMRPGPSPWAALRRRLARDGIEIGDGSDPDELGARLGEVGPIILVVDQLEELFTLCGDRGERERYGLAIARAARAAADRVRVVITLRDDFLVKLAELPEFRERLAVALHIVTTPAREDLLRILVEPAQRAGYTFDDPTLPGEMVDAVADAPGALALLSFTAARLWELRDRQLLQLSRRAYASLGGVGGALAQHAEATIGELTDGERAVAREAFRHLVTSAGTRAVLSRDEMLQLLGGHAAERVLERLVTARLLQTAEGLGEPDRVEVIHEALLTAWPRLVQWRREDAEGARLRDELRAAARRWDERDRPASLLWRDEVLAEYRLWRTRDPGALTVAEAAFAAASIAAAERSVRRRRALLGASFLIVTVFALLQLAARREAQDQRGTAESRLVTNYQEHARQLYLDDDPLRAFAYAYEAYSLGARTPTIEYLLARTVRGLARERASVDMKSRILSLAVARGGSTLTAASADGRARIVAPDGRVLATCGAHEQPVYHAELAPDGGVLATASWDGTAKLWDPQTCALRATLAGHAGRVFWIGFSPDGSRVFTTGTDRTARIWDAASGALVRVFELASPAYLAAFSPDGARFVASSPEPPGGARMWELGSGNLLAEFRVGPVQALAFDGAGRLLLASTERRVHVFDASGAPLRVLEHPQAVASAVWSSDGHRIASGDETGTLRIWNAETGALIDQTVAHAGRVTALAFDDRGERIATGGMDGRAVVWDATSAIPLVRVHGHGDTISALAFVDGGRRLATASWDHTLRTWSLDDPDAVTLARDAAFAHFDANGRAIAIARRNEVEIWDGDRLALHATYREHGAAITAAAVSGDGRLAASGDARGTVRLWSPSDGVSLREIHAHDGAVNAIAFSPDGQRVLTAGSDGSARLWDRTGTPHGSVTAGAPIHSTGFSPDGSTIFVVPTSGYVTTAAANAAVLFDAGTLERTAVLAHKRPIARLAFTADHRVLTVSRDGTAAIWRLDTNTIATRFAAPAGGWFDADLDPSGSRVVTCGQDPEAFVWDAHTGERIGALMRHAGFVLACAFSPDGRFLVTASTDGTARVWDAATLAPLESLAIAAPDPLLWPTVRFHPKSGRLLTTTAAGQVTSWQLGITGAPELAAHEVRCRVPWRVRDGALAPLSAGGPGC